MCPLGRPLRAVSGHAAWPWLRRPGRRGARYSAYSEAPAAMSPRQRHCSLPDPVRSGSPLARSLHLLPLTVLQPVQNDAVWGPLPRELPAARAEGREADGVSTGGGGKDPKETSRGVSLQGRSGPLPTAPRGAPDGGRGGGRGRTCAGREPPPCPTRLACLAAGRESSRSVLLGVKARDSGGSLGPLRLPQDP